MSIKTLALIGLIIVYGYVGVMVLGLLQEWYWAVQVAWIKRRNRRLGIQAHWMDR